MKLQVSILSGDHHGSHNNIYLNTIVSNIDAVREQLVTDYNV